MIRRVGWLVVALAPGCVITTWEGPDEPPVVRLENYPEAASAFSDTGPDVVAARHVLVMHRDSLRAPATVTRTREEALERAREVLARARGGEDVAALAALFSDEPGADTSGGDLGRFDRGTMVPEFTRAAFALQVGEVSDIVETEFGFHVIQRYE